MKSAKKLLAMFLAVIMLFSVMSVGMSALAAEVTVGSLVANADGSLNDIYTTTDDVIICVPETIYMTPGDGESVKGQYFVNNTVNSSGVVSLAAEKTQIWGSISIYAPNATKFSFNANCVSGGIGDPIIGTANTAATSSFEYADNSANVFGLTNGHFSYTDLALYINGKGLTFGQTALVEWEVTLYSGDSDTTGTTYYAYTTLYMPLRSVGAIAESRRSSNNNNEVSSWITGITSVGACKSTLGSDRVTMTGDGYFKNDPLWTNTFGGGSSESIDDFIELSDSVRHVHSGATEGAEWSRVIGYTGYLTIDASRYTNTNQVPNFRIGADILRLGSNPKDSTDFTAVWYTLGKGNEVIGVNENDEPDGWTKVFDHDRYGSTGRIVSVDPNYNVADVNGKHIHVATQVGCTYLSDRNYANAYVSVVLSTTDKSDLRALVVQATSLDETKYTVASWRGVRAEAVGEFHEALRDAAMVLGNPASAQGSIDAAIANLRDKMNSLKVAIKFDAATNGGVFTDNEEVKEYSVVFGTNNDIVLKSGILSYFPVAKAGYEFIGWSLDPDDYGNASLSSVSVTYGDTLYAHYAKTISVNFHSLADIKGTTTVNTNAITIYNNEESALSADVQDAESIGDYMFAGWTSDPTSTEGERMDQITGVTENADYYATYKMDVSVILDVNGGALNKTSVSGDIYYNYNLSESTGIAEIVLPEEEPTKDGHGFEGWDIDGVIYQAGDTVELDQSTTATAVWGIEKYDVTFNYKDAFGNDASVKVDVEYGMEATAPTVSDFYADSIMHYKFIGWDVAFDFIEGDTVVTAKYAPGVMHNYTTTGSYPTCEEAGEVVYTCKECGYSYTYSSDALGHNYVNIDSQDATCESDGYIVWECANDASHKYTEILPATGHSYEGTVYVAPTCTEDGYYISGICGNCGEDLAGKVIPALGHSWSIETEATCEHPGLKVCSGWTDENGEHHDCDVTEEIPQLPHDYTSVVTAPTCEEDGKVVYTCSDCGHSYETKIPATGHIYATIIVAPSCTSQGYTIKTCPNCGDSERMDYVPALGHSYVSDVVDPTCKAQGYTKHTCSVCNHSYKSDYVDALGHDYSIETVVDPTCTTKGYTLHECTRCNGSYKTDYVDATGHDYVFSTTVQPTDTQNGYDLYICSKCGDEYKETVYADGKALICYTIYDDEGDVVPNATLVLTNVETGEQITIKGDKNGYFTYVLPEGEYSVKVSALGYVDIEGELFVEGGEFSMDLSEMPCKKCSCLCHADSFFGKIYRLIIKMFSLFGKIYCCDDCEVWK